MIRKLSMLLVAWFLLIALASAATPLDYTRTILDLPRTIAGGNQTHDELAALSDAVRQISRDRCDGTPGAWATLVELHAGAAKAFLALFRELLERTYVQTLLLFQNPDFVYAGQQLTASGAIVDTRIVTPRDQFDVGYTLTPAGNRWKRLWQRITIVIG